MELHIGNLILEKMNERRVSIVELAKRLQMVRQNIHYLIRRKSIQIDLLQKVGKALDYDFFPLYSVIKCEDLLNKKQEELNIMSRQLEQAQAEIGTLNRIVEVLKEKK